MNFWTGIAKLVIGGTPVVGGTSGDVLSILNGRLSTIGGGSGFATLGANTFTGLQIYTAGWTGSAGVYSTLITVSGTAGGTIPIEERLFATGNADGSTDVRMRREIVQVEGTQNLTKAYGQYLGVQSTATAGTVSEVFGYHTFNWLMSGGSFAVSDTYYGHFSVRRNNEGDPNASGVIGEATVYRAGNSTFLPSFTSPDTGSITVVNGLKTEAIGSQIAGKVGTAYGVRIEDTDADTLVVGLQVETIINGHTSQPKKSIVVNGGAFPSLAAPNYFGVRTDMQLKVDTQVTYPVVLQNLGNNIGTGVGIQFDVLANATPPTRAPAIFAVNDSGGIASLFSLHFQTVNGTTPADNLVLNYDGTANIITALAIGTTTKPSVALAVVGSMTLSGGVSATRAYGAAPAGSVTPFGWTTTFSGDAGGTTALSAMNVTTTASGASNILTMSSGTMQSNFNQTGTITNANGQVITLDYTNSGNITNARGQDTRVILDTGSSGVIATGYAYYGRVMKSAGTGTYTNAATYYAEDSGGAHVTGNAIGYDSASMASAGTLTANFRAQNTSAATRWAFLASGSAPSGLLGGLRVGSVVQPVATLDITGTFAATKAYGAAAAGNNLPNQFTTSLSGDAGGTTDARNLSSTISYSGANGAANVNSLTPVVTMSHSAGTVTTATLIAASMSNTGNGAVTTMRGADFRVTTATGTGTITEGTGVYARVSRPSGTGTFTTARAFYADDSGGAQVTGDAIGFDAVAMQSAGGNTANFRAANSAAAGRYAYLSTGTAVSQFGGTVITVLSSTSFAGLRLPHGAAPTSPVDGDMWTTTAGAFIRINGVTKTFTLT